MIDLTNHSLPKDLNEKGCLALTMAVIESVFVDNKREYRRVPVEIDRAFLDSKFVAAAIDCTDNLEKDKMLKIFDKTSTNI